MTGQAIRNMEGAGTARKAMRRHKLTSHRSNRKKKKAGGAPSDGLNGGRRPNRLSKGEEKIPGKSFRGSYTPVEGPDEEAKKRVNRELKQTQGVGFEGAPTFQGRRGTRKLEKRKRKMGKERTGKRIVQNPAELKTRSQGSI